MGFADAYLLKAGLREALVEPAPHPGLKISVTIPVYNESGLERCLDSLFQCGSGRSGSGVHADAGFHAEVLVFINAPADSPAEILQQNQATLEEARRWIAEHPHPFIDFHVWLDHSFGKKEAGVGTSRKILMDEAVRRFNTLERPGGIIASLDADAVVRPDYLEALVDHFGSGSAGGSAGGFEGGSSGGPSGGSLPDGCSIRFEHPLTESEASGPEKYGPGVYGAITQYELHLRYYIQSIRFTGYPYAYQTVGSAFAVRADIYCKEGGMNRRQAGEDFYFIQKVAQRGNFSQCNATCVVPSPRPSDRVPFGTGAMVRHLHTGEGVLKTYNQQPFGMLRNFFRLINHPDFHSGYSPLPEDLPLPLSAFLEQQQFEAALKEIRANSASMEALRNRFWRWFNMFRIMKFLHFSRERGYPDIPVGEAASELLRKLDPRHVGIPSAENDLIELLLIYRMLDLR
jgi:glycosyltransferase involved in cell wall biosynthesis